MEETFVQVEPCLFMQGSTVVPIATPNRFRNSETQATGFQD